MKKILFLLCILVVTDVTFAQERASKSNNKEIKAAPLQVLESKASSFKFNKRTKTITNFVIDKASLNCRDCGELDSHLLDLSSKYPIIFKSNDRAIATSKYISKLSGSMPYAESEYDQMVRGILVVGKEEFKVNFLFSFGGRGQSFEGNIEFDLYNNKGKEDEVSKFSKTLFYIKGLK